MTDFAALSERLLGAGSDVSVALADADAAAHEAIDPALFDLCRRRIAMLLGVETEQPADDLADWSRSDSYSVCERACLAFTEQFVIDVSSLDDSCAAAVVEHLGHDGLAALSSALLVAEQRLRLGLAWTRLGL
jgi:hypothetical protein